MVAYNGPIYVKNGGGKPPASSKAGELKLDKTNKKLYASIDNNAANDVLINPDITAPLPPVKYTGYVQHAPSYPGNIPSDDGNPLSNYFVYDKKVDVINNFTGIGITISSDKTTTNIANNSGKDAIIKLEAEFAYSIVQGSGYPDVAFVATVSDLLVNGDVVRRERTLWNDFGIGSGAASFGGNSSTIIEHVALPAGGTVTVKQLFEANKSGGVDEFHTGSSNGQEAGDQNFSRLWITVEEI